MSITTPTIAPAAASPSIGRMFIIPHYHATLSYSSAAIPSEGMAATTNPAPRVRQMIGDANFVPKTKATPSAIAASKSSRLQTSADPAEKSVGSTVRVDLEP
ncbi:hypothetical protein TWF696_000068 [Orbilia brochopaga]|uniref:Uncharacterized protein n=1 Tax=Orbilia brochopaga TaxID=3140254 RepID=A0AAV9VBG0_9PEZI